MAWEHDVLEHWFQDTRDNTEAIARRMPWWFGPDNERDQQLEHQFGDLCAAARNETLNHTAGDPQSTLAMILLMDQLPRNLYRGTPKAFASDPAALALCLNGHSQGLDQTLSLIERMFFWMPLQHTEDLDLQELSVQLFSSLAAEDPEHDTLWTGVADYAMKHHQIIERFGRFPHRNETLGRESTPAEMDYMSSGGATFGQ